MSRPETTWAMVKNDISRMQKCLVDSLKTCETLEQGHLTQLKIQLTTSRQRIIELECENSSLRTLLQLGNNMSSLSEGKFTGGGMTESLQAKVDQHLLQAKQENEMLRERIRDLEVQAECLKEQVNIYKEDFEMERKDRENAQGLITDLKKQLAVLTGSRHHRTGNHPPTPHHYYGRPRARGFDVCDVSSVRGKQGTSACTAVDGKLEENVEHGFDVCDLRESGIDQASLGLTGSGFSTSSKFCTDGTPENDFIFAEKFSRMSPSLLTDAGSAVRRQSVNFSSSLVACHNVDLTKSLSCPSCWRTFSTEDHMLLLEHLEVCS